MGRKRVHFIGEFFYNGNRAKDFCVDSHVVKAAIELKNVIV